MICTSHLSSSSLAIVEATCPTKEVIIPGADDSTTFVELRHSSRLSSDTYLGFFILTYL
jgi:hypothetical protein